MSVELRLDVTGMPTLLSTARSLRNAQVRDLLREVGGVLETQTVLRIAREKTDPSGRAWAPLSESYRAWKRKRSSGGILEFRGHLRDSIVHELAGDEIEWGSNLDYAATHQHGDPDRGIGARTFLGISDANQREIEEVCEEYLRELTR